MDAEKCDACDGTGEGKEPIRVITVRLPKSLHGQLIDEAHGRNTSMNKLCIAKLLRVLPAETEQAAGETEQAAGETEQAAGETEQAAGETEQAAGETAAPASETSAASSAA